MNTHRLFLSQVDVSLGKETLIEQITKLMEKYGKVEEVFVPERSKKNYAFVSLDSVEAAQNALKELSNQSPIQTSSSDTPLFQSLKPATPHIRNQKFAEQSKRTEMEFKQSFDLVTRSNVICQLPRTHVERLSDFLKESSEQSGDNGPQQCSSIVVGSETTKSKSASLLFVKTKNGLTADDFRKWLESVWFVRPIVHRTYRIDESVRGELETDIVKKIFKILTHINESETQQGKRTIRLQVFPPKKQRLLLEAVDKEWEHFDLKENFQFAPVNATHVVNVIELQDGPGPDGDGGLYAMGSSDLRETNSAPAELGDATIMPNQSKSRNENDVCRAYWKLQESFERYQYKLPSPESSSLFGLDAGAAPGGWTKYLCEKLNCETIYSIDPGALAPSVLQLPQVKHWTIKIQDALPKLQSQNVAIDVWVSDMCVKDMEQQVDWLLKARDLGVVKTGTFFVLTLKCIIGHSTNTYDILVDKQMTRLEGIADKLQRLHLFTNRFSERTIVGYLS